MTDPTPNLERSHPLYGPRLKVAVAHDKIKELDRAIAAMHGSVLGRVPIRHNAKTGKNSVYIKTSSLCDARWAVTIGEIAHDLRSALDGLVYQLAMLNTNRVHDRTQFPIFRVGFTKRKRPNGQPIDCFMVKGMRNHLGALRQEHRALFERYQPYKRGNGGKRSVLWLLHELNNTDKHRLIPVIGALYHRRRINIWNVHTGAGTAVPVHVGRRIRRLEKGTEIMLPSGDISPDVAVKIDLFIDVRFDEGCEAVRRKSVRGLLHKMHRDVSKVLDDFSPIFGSDS